MCVCVFALTWKSIQHYRFIDLKKAQLKSIHIFFTHWNICNTTNDIYSLKQHREQSIWLPFGSDRFDSIIFIILYIQINMLCSWLYENAIIIQQLAASVSIKTFQCTHFWCCWDDYHFNYIYEHLQMCWNEINH